MIAALKREVMRMEESIIYQEIVGIGRLDEARRLILQHGKRRFSRGSHKAAQMLESITDLAELKSLVGRVFEVNSWDEFLADRR
jgi:hypothetical protein